MSMTKLTLADLSSSPAQGESVDASSPECEVSDAYASVEASKVGVGDDRHRRMPPEWKPHLACLLLYPHNPSVFRSIAISDGGGGGDGKCGPARKEVRNVARAIAHNGGEDVWIYSDTEDDATELRRVLKEEEYGDDQRIGGEIRVAVCRSDDSWIRDTGPTFVVQRSLQGQKKPGSMATSKGPTEADECDETGLESCSELVGIDWVFNAYGGPPAMDGSGHGGCYWPCDLDRQVARNVVSHIRDAHPSLSVRHRSVDLVLEGGSIHVDGEGTVLTTEECLLNPNRNPDLTKREIESILLRELGATKVLWLPLGLANDVDTNGHIDNFCAFIKPGEVVLAWTDDAEGDADNYRRCRLAEEVLGRETDARGRTVCVRRLHLPRPMRYTEEEVRTLECGDGVAEARTIGERLAASYVNFYIANEAVILPQFGDNERDLEAIETLKEAFPDRRVVGVYSREILLGGGNIHCITQQVPSCKLS